MEKRLETLMSIAMVLPAALACGCGGGDDSCDPVAQSGCDDGQVCEQVQDGEPACFDPVQLRGQVFDLADDSAVAGARVVALDPNSAPVSAVAITDTDGSYEVDILTLRDADGNPIDAYDVTLRADAAGYQTFPGGVRQAIPVDTSAAVRENDDSGPWVVENPLTQIGLIEMPADAGTASIHGTVDVPDTHPGVIVVAEADGIGYSGVADRDGDYAIFNLPAGDYTVTPYGMGVNYDPDGVSLADGDEADLDLSLNDVPATALSGSVDIVNGGAGDATSVIVVVASTFDDVLARGTAVPGLRAPEAGTAPAIKGAFTIDGVPDGNYVILAAFENDFLVRDPDPCISGTDLVYQDVGGGDTVAVDQQFKITGSLDIIGPGADGPEAVAGTPTFTWVDDSSEEAYDITVVDSFGNVVWQERIASVSGDNVSVEYAGDPLQAGMYYQFRVVSVRKVGDPTECKISQTEDLKGVFFIE